MVGSARKGLRRGRKYGKGDLHHADLAAALFCEEVSIWFENCVFQDEVWGLGVVSRTTAASKPEQLTRVRRRMIFRGEVQQAPARHRRVEIGWR